MTAIESYQDLLVWQRGMDLATAVYALTANWPRAELFGLTSQARRAAVSIPANVAEGWGRHTTGEFHRYLSIATGSLRELETHLLLSQRIGYTTAAQLAPLLDSATILSKQLLTLQRRLK
jgi:four helix bundle protein